MHRDRLPADIGVMHADLVKVRQVLFNLLSNAAKFTEDGRITLTVRRHDESASYSFAIRDRYRITTSSGHVCSKHSPG